MLAPPGGGLSFEFCAMHFLVFGLEVTARNLFERWKGRRADGSRKTQKKERAHALFSGCVLFYVLFVRRDAARANDADGGDCRQTTQRLCYFQMQE